MVMVPAGIRKQHIEQVISLDPTQIVITRRVREEVDGAYTTTPITLAPQIVRIFRQSPREVARRRDIAGDAYKLEQFILASAGADVEFDDEFEHALYGKFRVAEVIPTISQQIICGYHVRIEKVDL